MATRRSDLAKLAACVLATLAAGANASAAQIPLGGRARVELRDGKAGSALWVSVRDHLVPLGGVDACTGNTWLRLAADAGDSGERALACTGRTGGERRLAGADGLELRVSQKKLELRLRLPPPAWHPRDFIELRLRIGREAWCGRIERPFARLPRGGYRGVTRCRALYPRPNVLLVVLDDARADGIDLMPETLARVADEGVRFEHAFAPSPVCAPGRASILTALLARRHGVRQLLPLAPTSPSSADRFRETGAEQETLAVWLQQSGYRTGLFGKYMNGYQREGAVGPGTLYVPPGWDRWRAVRSPEHYGGAHGQTFSLVDESGQAHVYDAHEDDSQYSTDVTAAALREFVREADAEGRPFFAYWAPYAPHVELPDERAVPAARHLGSLAGLAPWRPPSWDEADVSDKPAFVAAAGPAQRQLDAEATDVQRIRGYEALLAVDEQLGLTLDLLRELGIRRDTIVIFTSDNGATWGEHRLFRMNKGCGYEECLRIPLLVSYPRRVAKGRAIAETAALHVDIAPTVAALTGAALPAGLDGRSLAGWLLDDATRPPPRTDLPIESWRAVRAANLGYDGRPRDGDRIELTLSDPDHWPRERFAYEFDDGGGATPGAVAVPILARDRNTFGALATAIQSDCPELIVLHLGNLIALADPRSADHGVYLRVIRDAGGILRPDPVIPDHLGVRDVASDYTWIEYETGETELYDIRSDPHQLDNVADDPRLAAVRARLAGRLAELRGTAPPE